MDWYTGPRDADEGTIERAYVALADEVAALAGAVTAPPEEGGPGVRVQYVTTDAEPQAGAAGLRERRTMTLRAAAADPPHPVLAGTDLDRLRTAHDVLGHAALGLGLDLQSEYAAWCYCRTLCSEAARPAAFCGLAGAATVHVLSSGRPALRADLPPAGVGLSEGGRPRTA